jgi:hypothetical protein
MWWKKSKAEPKQIKEDSDETLLTNLLICSKNIKERYYQEEKLAEEKKRKEQQFYNKHRAILEKEGIEAVEYVCENHNVLTVEPDRRVQDRLKTFEYFLPVFKDNKLNNKR